MKQGVSLETARAAKPNAARIFDSLVGDSVAVGITRIGNAGFGLKVNLTSEPPAGAHLPDEVDGVPVQVTVVCKIRKR